MSSIWTRVAVNWSDRSGVATAPTLSRFDHLKSRPVAPSSMMFRVGSALLAGDAVP
jgi:hypothetical protein